jgi:hypothetical protein
MALGFGLINVIISAQSNPSFHVWQCFLSPRRRDFHHYNICCTNGINSSYHTVWLRGFPAAQQGNVKIHFPTFVECGEHAAPRLPGVLVFAVKSAKPGNVFFTKAIP